MPLTDETLLHGRYRLERLLGQGGFARTYLARDQRTGSACAIKELSLKAAEDWKAVELFEREAKVLSQLQHADIPRFVDSFTVDSPTDLHFYLVQEYIAGKNLKEWVRSGRHFTAWETIKLAIRLCSILEYLHGLSPPLIHRDLKPSNVILGDDGSLHLIDFGSVRDKVLLGHQRQSGSSTIVGTYGYMPFEQFAGQALPASDLYALGALLVFLLSHREPAELAVEQMRLDFRPHVQIGDAYAALLDQLLAPEWRDRPPSATVARMAFEALLQPSRETPRKTQVPLVLGLSLAVVGLAGWWAWPTTHKRVARLEEPPAPPPSATVTPSVVPTPAAANPPPTPGPQASAGPGPYSVEGVILYDGQPISAVTDAQPSFWFRNEAIGKVQPAQATYLGDGRFRVSGLPAGRIGMQNAIDANPGNARLFPGDYYAWKTFEAGPGAKPVTVTARRVIHLTSPFDNAGPVPGWGKPTSGEADVTGPVRLAWEGLGPGVSYTYDIVLYAAPYRRISTVTRATIQDLSATVPLAPSRPGEFYLLRLQAMRDDRLIGSLLTHGAKGGLGWDLRFRVR